MGGNEVPVEVASTGQLHIVRHSFWRSGGRFARRVAGLLLLVLIVRVGFNFHLERLSADNTARHCFALFSGLFGVMSCAVREAAAGVELFVAKNYRAEHGTRLGNRWVDAWG